MFFFLFLMISNFFIIVEDFYFFVFDIKIFVWDFYMEVDIMDMVLKFSEMYEMEKFFEGVREEKGKELRGRLRGVVSGRRVGDGRRLVRGMLSLLSEKLVENWWWWRMESWCLGLFDLWDILMSYVFFILKWVCLDILVCFL